MKSISPRNTKYLSVLLTLLHFSIAAQNDTTSLNAEIKKANLLLESNLDSALVVIKKCVSLSRKNNFPTQLNKALLAQIQYYDYRGMTDSALLHLDEAIRVAYITGKGKRIVYTLLKASVMYSEAGKFEEAIGYAIKAEKQADQEKDTLLKIKVLHDIGYLYASNNLEQKGIGYFKEGLELSYTAKDSFDIANLCARIGGAYNGLNVHDSALVYNERSLRYFTLIHHKRGIGICYNNLANVYTSKKNYPKAIEYYKKGIELRKELGDDYALMILYSNLGLACYDNDNYKEALEALEISQKDCISNKNFDLITTNYLYISLCHHHLGHHDLYYKYSQIYIKIKDSIRNAENIQALAELQTKYESDKKQEQIKILQLEKNQENIQHEEKLKRRNYILVFILLVIGLLGIFIYLLFKRYKFTQRQQKIIADQKAIVDEKNHEIIDSINYAKTIQEAIIPTREEISAHFEDSFVLFSPKDIVSGDFYWLTKSSDYVYLAVADCTGHGVPGAFMSMMGISFLNELINEKKMDDTGDILDMLRIKVIRNLNKNSAELSKRDGMDIVLCRIDPAKKQLQFSGANNSLYLLRQGELKEFKGNKQPVGLHSGQTTHFDAHIIDLQKEDALYLFTDGLPDQFGGPKGKKFKYKQLEEILVAYSKNKLSDQEEILRKKFDTWKGNLEQVDDVTVIGLRI
jgi:serine phosphatase RsbU (regulator of sigma subunit)